MQNWEILSAWITIILSICACIAEIGCTEAGSRAYRSGPRRSAESVIRRKPKSEVPPLEWETELVREWSPSKYELTTAICTSCGKWNNPPKDETDTCWGCETSLAKAPKHTQTIDTAQYCIVCHREMFPGERIVLCPKCQVQGHRSDFMVYIKAKGDCPGCRERLRPSLLIEATPTE